MIGGWEPPKWKWYEKIIVYPLIIIEMCWQVIIDSIFFFIEWIYSKFEK